MTQPTSKPAASENPLAGLSPQEIAERVRQVMFGQDQASNAMGMVIDRVGPGFAQIRMRIRQDMLNGLGSCHGGFIATLADTAFAFACNSDNQATVASGFSIDFMAPGRLDDELTATAKAVSVTSRTGLYDIEIVNQSGTKVAVFRGRAHRLKDRWVVAQK